MLQHIYLILFIVLLVLYVVLQNPLIFLILNTLQSHRPGSLLVSRSSALDQGKAQGQCSCEGSQRHRLPGLIEAWLCDPISEVYPANKVSYSQPWSCELFKTCSDRGEKTWALAEQTSCLVQHSGSIAVLMICVLLGRIPCAWVAMFVQGTASPILRASNWRPSTTSQCRNTCCPKLAGFQS